MLGYLRYLYGSRPAPHHRSNSTTTSHFLLVSHVSKFPQLDLSLSQSARPNLNFLSESVRYLDTLLRARNLAIQRRCTVDLNGPASDNRIALDSAYCQSFHFCVKNIERTPVSRCMLNLAPRISMLVLSFGVFELDISLPATIASDAVSHVLQSQPALARLLS